ncbi:MAG: hypothetical protein JRJ46_09375, partial [Deltaproteobacteria bacterium]|nr:hypothetical protein [Deltaproteobacteria bacterium]
MRKLSTIIYKPDAKSRFTLAGAASAVALRKGLWRDKQGFSTEAYFSTSPRQIHAGQEGGNPRRTPLIGKIAIYGWTLPGYRVVRSYNQKVVGNGGLDLFHFAAKKDTFD